MAVSALSAEEANPPIKEVDKTKALQQPRLAIISTEKSIWSDLLMTRLGEASDVALVERDDLGKALDEIPIKDLLTDRVKRSRFGEIAGADFLARLSATENRVRLVMCDTKLGVTLQDLTLSTSDQPQDKILKALVFNVNQTIRSFAGGIKQVVAVPDFVCRDLTFDYNHLQMSYSALLRAAYQQIPGVAIVAVEEANAIAAERDIAPEKREDRAISIFIEGEYRTSRDPQSNRTVVDITLRAKHSEKTLVERKLPTAPLSSSEADLMTFFRSDLAKLATPAGSKIDEESQYKLLIERADSFGELGEFRRSADLREAALLLNPNADDQRALLVREHIRFYRNYQRNAGSGSHGGNSDETNQITGLRAVNDWKRALSHCEYLVINQRLSREEASDLCNNAVKSILSIRAIKSAQMDGCENYRKDFIRHVYSQVPALQPAPPKIRHQLTGCLDAYYFLFDCVLGSRCDNLFYGPDDLDLISDLLLNRLPDSMWPSYNLSDFLRVNAIRLIRGGKPENRFTKEEYLAFLEALIASNRPMARIYGRHGKFWYRRIGGEKSPALLQEAKDIIAAAATCGFDVREYSYFMGTLSQQASELEWEVKRELTHTTPVPHHANPPKESVPEPNIKLTPIALTLTNTGHAGKEIAPHMRWNSHGGWGGITKFVPIMKGIDAMCAPGAVFFIRQPGQLTQVLADDKFSFSDMTSDGKYVWISGHNNWGLVVLDPDGKELTRIGKEQGLPPHDDYPTVIHPLDKGKILVAGCFGAERRGWIALVEFDGMKAKVEVIHEATKVWDAKSKHPWTNTDPFMCFSPGPMFEHIIPGSNPRKIVFIPRSRGLPLLIDPLEKKVWVYPVDEKNRDWCPGNEASLSIDGVLWVPGNNGDFNSYRFNSQSGRFEIIRKTPDEPTGSQEGCFALVGDWLYYSGLKWKRINLVTGEEELLVENTRALPDYGQGGHWTIANSSHYGLVAFYEGRLYQAEVTRKK
jgi:hypothetical protein